jgi:nucleoporin GLE1
LEADAAELERQKQSAEAAEAAAKKAEEEQKRADDAAAAAKKVADEAKARKEKEDAEATRVANAAKAAADEAKRAEEERRTGVVTGRRLPSGSVPKIQVAAEASKQEGELAKVLADARALVAEYSTAPVAKRERRLINNNITVHVQQIAATRSQVEKKSVDIAQFLNGFQSGTIQRTFATLSLAKRVLTQCDSQVSKLNRFAFALAEVSVKVAVFDATFGQLLIALLHESCVLSVPKYYPFVQGRYASDDEYFKLMGYVAAEEQPAGLSVPKLETTDNFCRRIQGFMLFYGAYTQCDNSRHPHGINHAWAWASRLVNRVPPNRFSVSFFYFRILFILVWAI